MMLNKQLDEQRKQLPAYAVRQHIINCIQTHSTLILIGETGSGKSTQIPQFLYEFNLLKHGMVGITQPRRVAAITLARRVSQEKAKNLGELVGYAVRFENNVSEGHTKIKYMTEGILLREAINDKLLSNYHFIILDEAHERTINTDILFGILKRIQKRRKTNGMPELKIIIMSATMDVDHFSKYFDGCSVLYLPGRTYPVQVLHSKSRNDDYFFAAISTLFEIHKTTPLNHDVLMFLPGKEEIDAMITQIRTIVRSADFEGNQNSLRTWPLYSALSAAKQLEVFQRNHTNDFRRVIVATNIAETSVTIPGIKFVIDTGVVKMKNYDPLTGLESLKVVKISQAQAWQRTGRAGREAEGVCYRTYTSKEYDAFEKVTRPEILRCNLSSAIIQLLAIGINIETFDFIDRPPKDAIDAAFKQLQQLGAVRVKALQRPELTEIGFKMSKFPLDPTYSKILLSSPKFDCVTEILDLISVLSCDNIYVEPGQNKRDQALAQHAKFQLRIGDHMTLLNVFSQYKKQKNEKTWCTEHFLNLKKLQDALLVRQQLSDLLKMEGIDTEGDKLRQPDVNQILKCLITGLFNNVAEFQQRDNTYMVMANRQRASIHPTSVLSGYHANLNGFSSTNGNGIVSSSGSKMKDGKPGLVLFGEIVQTSQIYLRTVTRIEPEWIEEVAPECGYVNRLNNNNQL